MECQDIQNIQFSNISRNAINEIRRIRKMSNLLATVVGGGQVINIFLGNSPIKATYSLYSSDFEMMASSMTSVASIHRKQFEFVAYMAAVKVTNYKEMLFWEAVLKGCKVED